MVKTVQLLLNRLKFGIIIFTALHEMQTRSSDKNSVRLSVCLSLCPSNAWIVTKQKNLFRRTLLPEILGQPAIIGAKF